VTVSPADNIRGIEIAARLRHFYDLDEVLQGGLDEDLPVREHASRVAALRNAAALAASALNNLDQDLRWLQATTTQYPPPTEPADALAGSSLPAAQIAYVSEKVSEAGGFAATPANLSIAAQVLPAAAGNAGQLIQQLTSAKPHTTTVMGRRDKCLLAIAIFLGGYWCPPLAGAGASGILTFC
jgi:hypothetical protein